MNRTLSVWNDLRPFSVGFDELFDHFNNHLEYTVKQNTSYPPYNITKIDDLHFQIEMALAGFNKKDVEVKYADNQLTISRFNFNVFFIETSKCHFNLII